MLKYLMTTSAAASLLVLAPAALANPMNDEATAQPAVATNQMATTTQIKFYSDAVVEGNKSAQAAKDKKYPICRGSVQDNCINPRAAGKNWGDRPLSYWPGHPVD